MADLAAARPERRLRMRVVGDLERIGGADAEAAVQQASNDADAYVRNAALASLQRMKKRGSVP